MDCNTDSSVIYKTVKKGENGYVTQHYWTFKLQASSVGMVTRPWVVGVVAILSVVGGV